MPEETRRKQWSKNIQKAASRMSEQGLSVDLDDLGREADRAMASFYELDPDELRKTAEVAKREGIIDDEIYQKMVDDANEIEQARDTQEDSSK